MNVFADLEPSSFERDVSAEPVAVVPLRVSGLVRYANREFHVVNYTYVVANRDTGQALLVDPAWELETITDALARMRLQARGILLTHSHFDHVNLVAPLVELFDLDVWMSRDEIDAYGFSCPNLRAVEDATPFWAAGLRVVPWLTPGHSAGSACFYTGGNVFSGDTLFTEGCGMCSGAGADPRQMFESLRRLKARCAPGDRIFPGHSFGREPGRTFGELLDENVYLSIPSYEAFYAFRMRAGQTKLFDFR